MSRLIACLVLLAACALVQAGTNLPHHLHSQADLEDSMVMDDPHSHDGHDMHKDHKMGNMTHDMSHDMMMMMYFHFGVDQYVLFKEWKITTAGGMVASVIGVFLMGMLYEGLKYFREYLFKQYVSSIQFSTVAITGENGRVTQVHKVEKHRMLSWQHAVQTSLHIVQIVVSYFLMLIFMTYNVWLCLAVVFGAGVGYFVFGWKKASVVDITEHCH
ncbi:high affinity copper uptake protein 1-like [Argiope bruennichi]|uniref:Copper transport protein n=1 Tax=Argiope bruennichi TaxID=94029 RepID=A0A8T0E4G2_ARGBR|nr:high affinity copper uptake protein 1-like [Argiope bruennichi]XP_055949047.1 high affinity copper uptake protein 1-like [Argiope bruennichi]XP_055949048.1 high affinity copper uptake protein 1-like [Argiope bruennichi]XP_055949049.1 high affinity copper uptake protein 1-like [Argiope bruennichi]XP_055949050.1 high affinity copper uptake protein 1-like [Argiope bruennichi]KAF8765035.1 High affinity copper uptake protein 1 like protein [Argiope bruennichi]